MVHSFGLCLFCRKRTFYTKYCNYIWFNIGACISMGYISSMWRFEIEEHVPFYFNRYFQIASAVIILFIKNPSDILKNGYNVFPTKIWPSQTWPGLGTDRNPQDQIENKLPEIVCVLVNAPYWILGYYTFYLVGIWIHIVTWQIHMTLCIETLPMM